MVPWAGKGVGVRMKLWSRAGVVAGVLAWLLTAGAAGAGAASLSVQVLSNRADLVSGREALVAVALNKVKPASVKVTLNGSNVTSQFALRVNGSYAGPRHRPSVGQERAQGRSARRPLGSDDRRSPDRRSGLLRPPGQTVGVQEPGRVR